MRYRIVYQGLVIGHSDLERSSGLVHMLSGRFAPTAAFSEAEPALRPYGRSMVHQRRDGTVEWTSRSGEPLSPLNLEIQDESGNGIAALFTRISWPGDIPGWDFLHVSAVMSLPAGADPSDFYSLPD
jgi:hypothetical protein